MFHENTSESRSQQTLEYLSLTVIIVKKDEDGPPKASGGGMITRRPFLFSGGFSTLLFHCGDASKENPRRTSREKENK